MYKPEEVSIPLRNVDPLDLKNAPDFTMLYGVSVKDCFVRIFYDDNRRAGRSWDIPLTNNRYLIFPSTNIYCISNKQKNSLNFLCKQLHMNLSNYYWYFESALTPRFCDELIEYAKNLRKNR